MRAQLDSALLEKEEEALRCERRLLELRKDMQGKMFKAADEEKSSQAHRIEELQAKLVKA